jgi:hypothetical protein
MLVPEKPEAKAGASGKADSNLDRKGRSPVAGGLLFIPPSFSSDDGTYDLVVHFHGNTDAVEESFVISKINAVLITMNLGNGSGPYEDRFENPQNFIDLLFRTDGALEKRGLRTPHRRRLAFMAWSAGYGAVERAIEHPDAFEKVDAILLADGIHAGYLPNSKTLDVAKIAVFERYAREAMAFNKFFSITHSDVTPLEYAGTHKTTDALLADLGVKRGDPDEAPEMPFLKSIDGVVAKKSLRQLKPLSMAKSGNLIIRGYAGDQPEDHNAHLFGLAARLLPDLIEHWSEGAPRAAAE